MLAVGVVALLALALPFSAYSNDPTGIEGQVRDAGTGLAVANATIEIPALGLNTQSNSQGEFSWSGLSITGDSQAVIVQISAPGYGDWTLENVRILRAETLILDAELKDTPQTITVPPPSSERPAGFAGAGDIVPMLRALGAAEDIPIPETIRVRVTGNAICNLSIQYNVEVIDFKDYVKHVLPNEWQPRCTPGTGSQSGVSGATPMSMTAPVTRSTTRPSPTPVRIKPSMTPGTGV
jgi:hypothetical protein